MSRFERIEFNQPESLAPIQEPVQTEATFLRAAQDAFENGRFEQALVAYARALNFNPKNSRAWAAQAQILIELGERHEALQWASRGLAEMPGSRELLALKTTALARLGDIADARACSDSAFAERGAFPELWSSRAEVHLAEKDWPMAEQSYRTGLALESGVWLSRWLASRAWLHYRQPLQSVEFARMALAIDSTRAVLWLQLAAALSLARDWAPAAEAFAQARALDPALPEAPRIQRALRKRRW